MGGAAFHRNVQRLRSWVRANGRLPTAGRAGEERVLASFLNLEQQWMVGKGHKARQGLSYPPARRRLLQTVPKMPERLRKWDRLVDKWAKLREASAHPLDADGCRKALARAVRGEVRTLSERARKRGLPATVADSDAHRRSAAFLTTVLKAPAAYPRWLRRLLGEVPGLGRRFSAVARTCRQRPSGGGGRAPKRLRVECKEALAILRGTRFPLQSSRENVIADGGRADAPPMGLVLGMNLCASIGWTVSRTRAEQNRPLIEALCGLARRADPTFEFTTIQVNKNYATALHCDANNQGPSLITCLGSFTGGGLYVHGQGKVDVKGRFHKFDGNMPHLTCSFKGERYCVIYFVSQSYAKLPAKDVAYLRELGFKWPRPGLEREDYGPRAPRLLAAAAALPPALVDRMGPLTRMCRLADTPA